MKTSVRDTENSKLLYRLRQPG